MVDEALGGGLVLGGRAVVDVAVGMQPSIDTYRTVLKSRTVHRAEAALRHIGRIARVASLPPQEVLGVF